MTKKLALFALVSVSLLAPFVRGHRRPAGRPRFGAAGLDLHRQRRPRDLRAHSGLMQSR